MVKRRRNPRVRKTNTKNWGEKGETIHVPATIIIPSGPCPYEIEEFSRKNVIEWAEAITRSKPAAHTYKRRVYTYWLRYSFEVWSPEFKEAIAVIEDVVPDVVRTVDDIGA